MDKIDTSQIVDPTKLQPFLGPSLEFLQDSIKDALGQLAESMIGNGYSGSVGHVLFGATQSGNIIADGYVYFAGEIYFLLGDDITGYSDDAVVIALNGNGTPDPIAFSDGSSGNVHNLRRLQVVDQVAGTGLFDYANASFVNIVKSNVRLRTKVIEIGDWDMDANAQVSVAHGLTYSKIRNLNANVRNDADNFVANIHYQGAGAISADGTNVIVSRVNGGNFDSVFFDSTSYNRGWITIEYIE